MSVVANTSVSGVTVQADEPRHLRSGLPEDVQTVADIPDGWMPSPLPLGQDVVTSPQIALAWLLAVSPVTLPIPGTATPAHLEDNLAAAALQLEQDEIHAITAAASRATQRATQAT
jgi:aryl-alcohol dehydrogenase-like predicted oxidoreductase